MSTRVHAVIETIPPDHTGVDPDREQREVFADAATYEQARDRLVAELPAGWRIVNLHTT